MNKVDYKNVKFYPELIKDYFDNTLTKNGIIDFEYNLESLIEKSRTRKFNSREILHNVLKKQHSQLQLTAIQKLNIEQILDENCFTVTTGHQLSLYGGPAFFYSKMIDAIELAKKLNATDSSKKYLPVFWMASEDHDFEEIQSVNLFNKQLKWESTQSGAVGQFNSDSLKEVHDEFKAILGNSEKANALIDIFIKAYQSGKSLAEATRYFVHEIFKDSGLLILDGDDSELKKLLKPVIQKEITSCFVEQSIQTQISKLNNYKIQVQPRNINLFYLKNGSRERIIKDKDTYKTVDDSEKWSKNEFNELIESTPEKISPNVLLRPLYQELCLPNIAYVGGAGEISYWLELPPVFKAANIDYPIPVVRNSYLYLNQKQLSTINSLGLEIADFFEEEEKILNKFIENQKDDSLSLTNEKQELSLFFQKMEEKAIEIDKNLSKVIQGELKRSISSLENIERRFINAEKNKKEQEKSQIINLKGKIFPNGSFQERVNSIFDFSLKSNLDVFDLIKKNNTPLDNNIKVVVY